MSQYFPPEMGAPAARVYELSRHWVERGQDVTVLTGFPNHPTGVVPAEYRRRMRRGVFREEVDGIRVVRTWLLPRPNGRARERMLNYASYWLSASMTGSFLGRPDIVIATSPQLLVGLSGWWISRVKRVPFVFEVRDLWPESIAAVGIGARESRLYRTLSRITRFLYRHSDRIVVVTPAFKEAITRDWGISPDKMSVVDNGVETDLFSPDGPRYPVGTLGLDGKFIVSYVGTMGYAHGLQTLLQAATYLRASDPDVAFLLVGEGADKEALRRTVASEGLDNVHFLDQQPRERIPSLLRASDVSMVLLRKSEVFKTVIPTKMLEAMSCGVPLVLGVDGQARQLLEEAGAGVFVEPEDAGALAHAVHLLRAEDNLRRRLSEGGRRYTVEHLSRGSLADGYLDLLESTVAARAVRRSR